MKTGESRVATPSQKRTLDPPEWDFRSVMTPAEGQALGPVSLPSVGMLVAQDGMLNPGGPASDTGRETAH